MRSLRAPLAALLCAVVPASAQLEVRTVVGAPAALAAPGLPVLAAPSALLTPPLSAAAVPAFSAAPALSAAPTAAPALGAALAAPAAVQAAAPASAPAMSAALADFARVDLKSVAAGDARNAGETLMARVLGGASADAAPPVAAPEPAPSAAATLAPAPPAGGRRLYLLSRPLRVAVKLGPLALAAHAFYAVAWELAKAALAWHATHSAAAVAALELVELPMSPAMATVRSLVDLGQRYWRRKAAILRELARTPGVERVRVLTTGEVRFLGPLAREKDNTGLIFVESASGLPATVDGFGAPIPIDAAADRVRLTLSGPGVRENPVWTAPLGHLLEGRAIPPEVAAAWRAALNPGKAPLKILLGAAKSSALRLDAELVAADGTAFPLGAIAEGPTVRTLAGLGRLDRLRAFFGRSRSERRLPVSDAVVERPGAARTPGLGAALTRAWRRLTGSLIVARP